jgi:cytochrome c biogenesis protein CcmG/thiol:disulfide interchange protein DsbE
MKRIKGLLFLLAGLAAGVLLGLTVLNAVPGRNNSARPSPPATGKSVQDFTLLDINGQSVRLSALRGKPVVVNFWATWCVPCREEMPLLGRSADQLKDRVVFLTINNDEQANVVREFMDELSIQMPALLDPGGKINELYYVQSYPNTFFIDSDGVLRAQHIGQLDESLLNRGLEAVKIIP